MKTHFDEITEELQTFYGQSPLFMNVIVLFWLPRLYRYIKRDLVGEEIKIGFLDSYNLAHKRISVVNISNASQCIDFINFAKQFNIENVIAIGLAGSYKLEIGTIFIPKEAIGEEILTSYFTKTKVGNHSDTLYSTNKHILGKFSKDNGVKLNLGKIVSLDLFSRETKDFLKKYSKISDTVDLEVAPFYIMCNLFEIHCFAIMLISDNLEKSYFLREGEEISIVHKLYEKIPALINQLKFTTQ